MRHAEKRPDRVSLLPLRERDESPAMPVVTTTTAAATATAVAAAVAVALFARGRTRRAECGTQTEAEEEPDHDFVHIPRFGPSGSGHFGELRVADIAYHRTVARLGVDASTSEAFDALTDAGAHYGVVHDAAGKPLCVVSVRDVALALLGCDLCLPTLRETLAAAPAHHVLFVPPTARVETVVPLLLAGRYVGVAGEPCGILSQGSLLRHMHAAGTPALTATLADLGLLAGQRVETASAAATVREAVGRLLDRNITSLPLVDAEGRAVCIFSLSDLRCAVRAGAHGRQLDASCIGLVQRARAAVGPSRVRWDVILTCRPDDSLATAMGRMIHHDVHHLYALAPTGRPTGVVSWGDILRVVA